MITFLADDHYNAHPGAALYEVLQDRFPMAFAENNQAPLEDPAFPRECELLILNVIADTCGQPLAGPVAERNVRAYLEQGKPLLLLHGSSAAFWHWDWWRELVGFRWVRGGDPDGVPASTHPVRPYRVDVSKCRHPLCKVLQPMDLAEDEIYTRLEQVNPAMVLMETTIAEGTFPQCWENTTPWGGRVIGFLPGHRKEVVQDAGMVANVTHLIESLLAKP
jgi:pimeloyl-ACP methyl ester carboxylesterase